jgi:metal-responsive CopG/Arc/MetJ family transcriptional regulator
MSIRTTVTLDEDVLDRIKRESRSRGASFRDTLNDLLRIALQHDNTSRNRKLKINPVHMGYHAGLNHDDVESLLEYAEGERHR